MLHCEAMGDRQTLGMVILTGLVRDKVADDGFEGRARWDGRHFRLGKDGRKDMYGRVRQGEQEEVGLVGGQNVKRCL